MPREGKYIQTKLSNQRYRMAMCINYEAFWRWSC